MEDDGKRGPSLNAYITEDSFILEHYRELSISEKDLVDIYEKDKGHFVFELGFHDKKEFNQSINYLRTLSREYIRKYVSDTRFPFAKSPFSISFSDSELNDLVGRVPFLIGSENVKAVWVQRILNTVDRACATEINNRGGLPESYFKERNIDIIIPSRIFFHLVENKQGKLPFAFLATYSSMTENGIKFYPLKNALSDLKDEPVQLGKIMSIITTVAQKSSYINELINSGKLFYPLQVNEEDAYTFLKETSLYEENGIVCRIPKWYSDNSCKIQYDFKEHLWEKMIFQGVFFTKLTINHFSPELFYHGIPITIEEIKELLSRQEGLEFIKGRWVENNHDQLEDLLFQYEELSKDGTSLLDILKNKSGYAGFSEPKRTIEIEITHAEWLDHLFEKKIEQLPEVSIPEPFTSILRRYQMDAVRWCYQMYHFGFGVCLADDMGLGKTLEVLAFLKKIRADGLKRILAIVPATLVDNWKNEIQKFDLDIDVFTLRGNNEPSGSGCNAFLTLTTYQTAIRSDYIDRVNWDCVILDEAQAIKNYYTLQAKKVKSLHSKMRIAMTGTPIENSLLELWSIFDFINPGLLGTRQEFTKFYLSESADKLKSLIDPFILRRLKTDKNIISDLPEKNEIDVPISLTKDQIVIYKQVVNMMNKAASAMSDPRQKKIAVLSSIIKLKQVCNHPSQYYGTEVFETDRSGKFIQLQEICETIHAKREKVLVFTQFKEIIKPLDDLLAHVFEKHGRCIDGTVSMKNRNTYVQEFQSGTIPYMVLTIKTAGVGLNLTAAQNVIHFDRWWNPAVENQATDRAYRIGQKKNVMVYKFIAMNTIEEQINNMLSTKQALADTYINNSGDNVLSKLSIEELLNAARYRGTDINE